MKVKGKFFFNYNVLLHTFLDLDRKRAAFQSCSSRQLLQLKCSFMAVGCLNLQSLFLQETSEC